MYERRNGREDAEGMDEMMMMRQMETTVTEVGTASTSLQERESVRERESALEGERQRVRVETGKCETEFKERTVKALFFKLENLIRFL